MEPVPQTYVAAQQILAAELNDLCMRADGSGPGDTNNHLRNGIHITGDGCTSIVWMRGGGSNVVTAGNLCVVDASIDWRDRLITVDYAELGFGVSPVNTNDYLLDVTTDRRVAYTGTGALGAASAPVAAGVPPVPASGTSWACQIVTNVWVYAVPSTGELALYNGTGASLAVPMLLVRTTAKTGYR